MLARLPGPPVERDREMEDADAQIAVEHAAFGRTESGITVIQPRSRRAAADGAGSGIDECNCRQRSLRGCSATRPEAAHFGRTLPVARSGLAKIGEFGKSRGCHTVRGFRFPYLTGYADPPLSAGFAIL